MGKLFRIEEYPYRVLEVQVDNRMRDKNYTDIVNIIHSLLKDVRKRIVCNKEGIIYTRCQPISFEILYDSNKEITFNFAVNELDSLYFKNRLQTILPNSTLKFLDEMGRNDYIDEFKDSAVYKYNYDKHYMLSLNTKVSPIQSLLAIKKDLDDKEKLLLQTLILPVGNGWKTTCDDNWKKVRRGHNVTNGVNIFDDFFSWVDGFLDGVMDIIDDIIEIKPKSDVDKSSKKIIREFESDSKTKTNYNGFKIDINSFIKTDSNQQSYNIGKSIETCFRDMASDNALVMGKKKIAKKIDRKILFKSMNIVSELELANLIKLPDNILQRRFNIKSVRINQIDIPKECRNGNINLGSVEYHGDIVDWYMPSERDISCLPMFILTKMGGGKTTLLLKIAHDTREAGEGLVLFDYIKDCQTAKALIEMYPDTQIIRFDSLESLDNFSFPEIQIEDGDDVFTRKLKANMIANEIKYLINSMASDSDPLTRIMSKYLVSACKVVFVHKNKNLKNLLDVLEIKEIRNKYIGLGIKQGIFSLKDREIVTLKELDKDNISSKIQGLLDRFSVITEDTLFGAMLDKVNNFSLDEVALDGEFLNESYLEKISNNVNFVDIMDKQQPVVIMMPQDIFTNRIQKDVLCTYYMSRIRLAMSRRKDVNKICRVEVDEPHQIPNTMNLIKDTIAEPRKFGLSYVMAMHSFGQVKKEIKDIILDIGCHFMLLKGISESGFNELKTYIGDDFEYEDMKEMDWDYGSLNLISIRNEYKVFMSKLPDALRDGNGKLFIGD